MLLTIKPLPLANIYALFPMVITHHRIGTAMTNTEYNMIIRVINDFDLESGKVLKANGQWYIEGKRSDVPRPVIKLSHWTEGSKKVVIEQQKSSPFN